MSEKEKLSEQCDIEIFRKSLVKNSNRPELAEVIVKLISEENTKVSPASARFIEIGLADLSLNIEFTRHLAVAKYVNGGYYCSGITQHYRSYDTSKVTFSVTCELNKRVLFSFTRTIEPLSVHVGSHNIAYGETRGCDGYVHHPSGTGGAAGYNNFTKGHFEWEKKENEFSDSDVFYHCFHENLPPENKDPEEKFTMKLPSVLCDVDEDFTVKVCDLFKDYRILPLLISHLCKLCPEKCVIQVSKEKFRGSEKLELGLLLVGESGMALPSIGPAKILGEVCVKIVKDTGEMFVRTFVDIEENVFANGVLDLGCFELKDFQPGKFVITVYAEKLCLKKSFEIVE